MVHKMKRTGLIILLIILLATFGLYYIQSNDLFQVSTTKTSQSALLQDNLIELSEWTTLKYEYSNVIVSRTEKNLSILGISDISYAEAIKLIEYSGYLKAGPDLSMLEISYDESSKKLLIRVPKSTILDNVVETETVRVEDIKGNIFSDYPTQTIFDEINEEKEELEQEKVKAGFLEEANQRVQLLLTSFLNAKGFDQVEIEFVSNN